MKCSQWCRRKSIARRALLIAGGGGHIYLLIADTENKAFIITHGKPHKPASTDTISRWVKDTLKDSGINADLFTSHSCRSASTSKAFSVGVPLQEVLKRANWNRT